jgi:hypothetical protein
MLTSNPTSWYKTQAQRKHNILHFVITEAMMMMMMMMMMIMTSTI